MPEFKIGKKLLPNGVCLLSVQGFLDAHTFEELERTVNDLFEQGTYKLVVDLSGLDYISSAGAGVFIGAIGTAQDNNGNIVLVRPSASVKEVFDLLGLSQIFLFRNTPEDGVRALVEA